jgi:hypothetical protein
MNRVTQPSLRLSPEAPNLKNIFPGSLTTPPSIMTIKNPEADHSPFFKDLQTPGTIETPLFSITPMHALALNNIYKFQFTDERTLFIPKDPHCTTSTHPPKHCKKLGKCHCAPVLRSWTGEREVDMGAENYTTDPHGLVPSKKIEPHGLVPRHAQEEDAFPKTMIRRRAYEEGKLYPAFGSIDYEEYLHYIKRRGRRSSTGEMASPATKVRVKTELFHSDTVTKEDFPSPFCELGNKSFEFWFMRNVLDLGVKENEAKMRLGQVMERTRVVLKERDEEAKKDEGQSLVRKVLEKIGEGYEKYKEKRRWMERSRWDKKHAHWVEMEDENRRREVVKSVAEKIRNERQQLTTQQGWLQRFLWWR